MNPFLIYFIKVNIAIALFYFFYRLFFANDTLWKFRRIYLIFSILLAFIYPLFSIVDLLEKNEPVVNIISEYVMLQEIVITPEKPVDYTLIFMLIYGIVALFLFIRLLLRIISILSIRNQGKKSILQDIGIISIDKEMAPFSFFGDIFINPALHNEKETKEILTHELTHVRQMHSADVLFAEFLSIICWMNPAAWLMKREIRHNLEYLADDQVLNSGFDSRSYQYHLLQLSYQTPDYKLTNQFNISPLKKRITMMNQKKTPKTGMLKYLMIAPLALALVVSSNAEKLFSQMQESFQQEKVSIPDVIEQDIQLAAVENATENISPAESIEEVAVITSTEKMQEDKNPVFSVVENMPTFPGGEPKMMEFLSNNIRYPGKAQEAGTQGRVICQFVIDRDGSITDIEVVRSVDPLLDAEAIRVISLMPNWTPGTQRGQVVRVKYTLPINFALQGKTPEKQNKEGEKAKTEASQIPDVTVVGYGSADKKETVTTPNEATESTKDIDSEKTVYIVVESMPAFPGGDSALKNYLSSSVKYPVEAQKKGIHGRVICQFVVNRDGSIVDVEVVRKVDKNLDAEAIRVIEGMPKWTPGTQRGKTVRVKYTLPISFKLQ